MADVDARLLQNAWESFAVPHDISYLLNCLMGIEKEEEPEQMKSYWTSGGGGHRGLLQDSIPVWDVQETAKGTG